MPRHIRFNLRMWAFVILPRIKVHLMVHTYRMLDR